MDQSKTGALLRQLRLEKQLTQEQLAEKFYVSGRTVSRWETGSNMPELSLLIELADFYDVDIRELIDGERKSENMTEETKDTLTKVAQYTDEQKNKLKKKMLDIFIGAMILMVFAMLLQSTDGFGYIPAEPLDALVGFVWGFTLGVLGIGVLYLTGVMEKAQRWKLRTFGKK